MPKTKPSGTARAIQLDKQSYDLFMEATRIAGTASNPNTCAETHVARIAERIVAQAEFLRHLANGFATSGRKKRDGS
jgi:hypothetical protein